MGITPSPLGHLDGCHSPSRGMCLTGNIMLDHRGTCMVSCISRGPWGSSWTWCWEKGEWSNQLPRSEPSLVVVMLVVGERRMAMTPGGGGLREGGLRRSSAFALVTCRRSQPRGEALGPFTISAGQPGHRRLRGRTDVSARVSHRSARGMCTASTNTVGTFGPASTHPLGL